MERRKQIVSAVQSFGGRYSKDLNRECTHLISAKPTSESKSSEKVQWAVKEIRDRALQRRRGKKLTGVDIRIIYEEWLWDCVAYHGRFNEDGYDAKKPRPVGRVRAEDVLDGSVWEQQEQAAEEQQEVKAEAGEDEGPAVLRKRKRDDLVGELISTTAIKVEPAEEERKTIVPSNEALDTGADEPERRLPNITSVQNGLRKASLLHATRTASFGPTKSGVETTTPSMPGTIPQPTTAEILSDGPELPPIFAGLRFSHLIDEAYEGLERALTAHGGEVVTETQRLKGEHVDHVIVRL